MNQRRGERRRDLREKRNKDFFFVLNKTITHLSFLFIFKSKVTHVCIEYVQIGLRAKIPKGTILRGLGCNL